MLCKTLGTKKTLNTQTPNVELMVWLAAGVESGPPLITLSFFHFPSLYIFIAEVRKSCKTL